jgi:ribosomal protein L28
MPKCEFTGRVPHSANNVPKSMHKTKRLVQPNIQKVGGVKMSTAFRRTLKKYGLIEPGKPVDLRALLGNR